MSKQRYQKKSSGHSKGDHDSFSNDFETKTSAGLTKDFLAKEKDSSAKKNENSVEVGHESLPVLSDSNVSTISLNTTANDTINGSSLSDTVSIDSNTSAQIDSFLAVGDADIGNESINKDEETDLETSIYQTADAENTNSKTATPNEQPSLSEASTITADTSSRIKIYPSIEEFEKNLPPTVTLVKNHQGSKIYIIGTAHFSEESQDDVSMVIRNVRPDVVMVELCSSRIHMLHHDEKTLLQEASDMSFAKIRSITRSNGLLNGLFYILMLNMSAKLTKDLGMAPGGEFRRAAAEMKRFPNPVLHLGDRPLNITLQRAFNGLSLWQTIKIVFKLIFSNKTITKEEVEQCKEKDLLEELMEQMADEYPVFREVFVNERDLYLCHSLTIAAAPPCYPEHDPPRYPITVVGVVGIGHVKGILHHWGKVEQWQVDRILRLPKPSLSTRIFKFTMKYGTYTLIGYGVYKFARPRISGILPFINSHLNKLNKFI